MIDTRFLVRTDRPATGTTADIQRVGRALVDNAGKYRIWVEVPTTDGTGWIPLGLMLDCSGDYVPLSNLPDPITLTELEDEFGILEGPHYLP